MLRVYGREQASRVRVTGVDRRGRYSKEYRHSLEGRDESIRRVRRAASPRSLQGGTKG